MLRAFRTWLDQRRRRNGRRTNRLVNVTVLAVMDSLSEWESRHWNDQPAPKIVCPTDPEVCAALVALSDATTAQPRPKEIIDAGWLQHTAWRMRDVAGEIERRLRKPPRPGSVLREWRVVGVVGEDGEVHHGFVE